MQPDKDVKFDGAQNTSSAPESTDKVQSGVYGKEVCPEAQAARNISPADVAVTQSPADVQLTDKDDGVNVRPTDNCPADMRELTPAERENVSVCAEGERVSSSADGAAGEEDGAAGEDGAAAIQPPASAAKHIFEYAFAERSQLAADVVTFISDNFERGSVYVNGHMRLMRKFPALDGINLQYFEDICRSIPKFVGEQYNNLYVAFVLFYIYTCGNYPQKYWSEAVLPAAQTNGETVRILARQFSAAISSESEERAEFESVVKGYQRAEKRKRIALVLRKDDGLGMVNVYEMLLDVFVSKYCNYSAALWKRTIEEYLGKSHVVRQGSRNSVNYRCEYAEDGDKVQMYAVSYMGCMKKPMHVECEDYCFVERFDEDTWLAVCCDGVGSCTHSSLGSWAAAGAVSAVLGAYLAENDILGKQEAGEKRSFFGKFLAPKDKNAVSDTEKWGRFMYYLQNDFAAEVYEFWKGTVTETQSEAGVKADDISQYTTTMQFAFGCRGFVACGRVGDGRFFVKKHERTGDNTRCGGFMLNDGLSGVTQAAVYTIAHLKRNPHAMRVSFFSPDELDDIIISSDGCDGYLGDGVADLIGRAAEFAELPFGERCEKLAAAARLCAEVNSTMYGSGDDSTIVHIHFRR